MINVTKTYLPPLGEFNKYLSKIWESNWLTNHGPLVCQLEEELKKYLGVKHLFLVTNGTIALQIAIKALELENEIITTPFSYVATTSSAVWEGCEPVFADIESDTLTIDPKEIQKKITPKTTGIIATHVYGNACNAEEIIEIAREHKLKVLFDAAHAFGVNYNGKSILNYGDISVLSFHATKIFHTIEGGAVVTNNDSYAKKISYLRNFGHDSPEKFSSVGINGKASEIQAAMGLCVLPKINDLIGARKIITKIYDDNLNLEILKKPNLRKFLNYNYAYYPIIFPTEKILLDVLNDLSLKSFFPRRYFYPSLNNLSYVKKQIMPISEDIASRIMCLPMYYDLSHENVIEISKIINKNC